MDVKKIDLMIKARELLEKQGRLPNGRKSRSDKGKSRKPYLVESNKSFVWKYQMVLSKIHKKDRDNTLIAFDENGYYIDIDEQRVPEFGQFVNKSTTRSVKYKRTQVFVSLERYRFEAYQELALKYPDKVIPLPNPDLTRWALECGHLSVEQSKEYFQKKEYTYSTFFSEFYHVRQEDIPYWTYSLWKSKYDRVPGGIELDNSFVFMINESIEETHPEWSWYQRDKELEDVNQKMMDQEARSARAKLAYFNRKVNKGE